MRYNKIKTFVIFSVLCFFVRFSFAAGNLCSECKVREGGIDKKSETVCSCQKYCEVVDNVDPDKIIRRVKSGCRTGQNANYDTNGKYYSTPNFEPEWTIATDGVVGIKGGQYIGFQLEGGVTYRWTTYDAELDDVMSTKFNQPCNPDDAASCDDTTRCYAGYCMWPFDTELTLINTEKGTKGCSDGTVVAFSRSGGFDNQSELEYKAPEDMMVYLLVTNNKYDKSTQTFVSCQDSNIDSVDKFTIVKWQRYVQDYCSTCGKSGDYSYSAPATLDKAPNWTIVSDYEIPIDLRDYSANLQSTETWLKPGSYVDFEVEEGKIYRWATCKSVFFDTQLTLFKKSDDDDSCGKFLAFNDDSEVSYLDENNEFNSYDQSGKAYCPAGTKQSVLEWHANFTGEVRLLFNEYYCSQCAKDNNATQYHWTHCFSVENDYVVDKNSGEVLKDSKGFPLVATSSNTTSEDTKTETLTYLYSFPLDWQRYDCSSCNSNNAVKKVYDFCGYAEESSGACVADICNALGSGTKFCTGSGEDEECGGTVSLHSGDHVTFALRRGSKYIFETPENNNAIITVKAGKDCASGKTLAQGIKQVAYFAEASAVCPPVNDDDDKYDDPNNYSDVVTVLVSESECNNRNIEIKFKYSFYTDEFIKIDNVENAANSQDRFREVNIGGGGKYTSYYEDTATGLRFIEAQEYARTWEEAGKICGEISLGGSSGSLACPDPICPEIPKCKNSQGRLVDCYSFESSGPNTCLAKNDTCASPTCYDINNNYEPYVEIGNDGTPKCTLHPDWCGKCISKKTGTQCNQVGWDGKCLTSNTCVTFAASNAVCGNKVGLLLDCPGGSENYYSNDDLYCYKEEGSFDLYSEPISEDPDVDSFDYGGVNSENLGGICPSGTVKVDSYGNVMGTNDDGGDCVAEGCGRFVNDGCAYCGVTPGYVKSTYPCNKTKKCYTDSGLKKEAPCCCGKIRVIKSNGTPDTLCKINNETGVVYGKYKNGKGTEEKCSAPGAGCESGWDYINNQCHKCVNEGYIPYATNDHNVACRPACDKFITEVEGDKYLQKCMSCQDGSSPILVGDEYKCLSCDEDESLEFIEESGEYKCKKLCSGLEDDGKCYPEKVAKVASCDMEGKLDGSKWIEKGGYCKKLQTDEKYQYPDCYTAGTNMQSTPSHICKNDKSDPANFAPNTIDCMCKTDYCGIGNVPKICHNKVCVVYENGKDVAYPSSSNKCKNKELYPVNLQTIDGQITCVFTNQATYETCGAESTGWELPDINQLYSLIDFDLYDPATAFPFKSSTYLREDIDKTCDNDDQCFKGNSSADGSYVCIADDDESKYGKCARNNWFWSGTNAYTKKGEGTDTQDNTAKFVWALNMEDGRTYRALKGCYDNGENDCSAYSAAGLSATPHQVMCIKGSPYASLFHTEWPQKKQIFSGWICDKDDEDKLFKIYFEIVDSDGNNVGNLVGDSAGFIKNEIIGIDKKVVEYGLTDGLPVVDSDDFFQINKNCNGVTDKAYVFTLDLNNPAPGKESAAEAIKSIYGFGTPPYFVTAYAIDPSNSKLAIIQPVKELFVLKNVCGDEHKTFDGTYLEECEKSDFKDILPYQSSWSASIQSLVCDKETCTKVNEVHPGCGDKIIQSQYCVKSDDPTKDCENKEGENCKVSQGTVVYASGQTTCNYYNFEKEYGTFTEKCDCGSTNSGVYLLNKNANGTYSCGMALSGEECPSTMYYDGTGEPNCVLCNKCSIDTSKPKPRCGDGKPVSGREECDDGNLNDNDDCLNNCSEAKCGDGVVRKYTEKSGDNLIEACDAGELNGTYEGGCSEDCQETYVCGDGKIQNKNCAAKCDACDKMSDLEKEDCINTWCGENCVTVDDAEEECDEGRDKNGQPITYAMFIESLAGSGLEDKCSVKLHGKPYSVTSLQKDFDECLSRYKIFVQNHSCSKTCVKSNAKYCGDGKIQRSNCGGYDNCEVVAGANEECDQGYNTTKQNFNGKGFKDGCSLDCQLVYGCDNGIIERPECPENSNALECVNGTTPTDKIGFEYAGESIGGSGATSYVSEQNVLLFVKMTPDTTEVCDAGYGVGKNGTYGICNSTCTGQPYCGDSHVSTEKEECDLGSNVNGGNRDIELAWSMNKNGTCIGVYLDSDGNNECLGSEWDADVPCCQFGRWCGDGIIDNYLDGIGKVDESGNKNVREWRESSSKWEPQGDYKLLVGINNIDLAVAFTTTKAKNYQDVELNINIPIVKGLRYFVEYDVKVQKLNNETAMMRGGAKMYGSGISSTNPRFFIDGDGASLENNVWIHKKNSTPMVMADDDSSSLYKWDKNTSYVKIYFQFQGVENTVFFIRGLKVYTLESGKGMAKGTGSYEMCDNGEGNLDIEDAKADDTYMSNCTKYVNEDNRYQEGCMWTNYCGDKILQRRNCDDDAHCKKVRNVMSGDGETCDNGRNETNVYNGCEPGCTERGPHCGDNILDITPSAVCPFTKFKEAECEAYHYGQDCPFTEIDESKCNRVTKKYNGDTYDEDGNFTGDFVTFVSESCDKGISGNQNWPLGKDELILIKEGELDVNNYKGDCREDCTFARCGDGILDHIVLADSKGEPKKKEDGSYEYVEECDCGLVETADALLKIPKDINEEYKNDYAVNQKDSKGEYICVDKTTGKYYPNSNYGGKSGVSCRSNCTISRCGDGILDKLTEECDDGNDDNHDDCTNDCKLKSNCGDGLFSFKRSYLCEELLDLPLESSDKNVPTMKTMRDRGVVDCCISDEEQYSTCHSEGKPDCQTLANDLQRDSNSPTGKYGKPIALPEPGKYKYSLHYWFDKKVLHCCFNEKYVHGADEIEGVKYDDYNCINFNHRFYDSTYGDIKTLKDYVYFECRKYQSINITDDYTGPWEKCGNVSYSERCEFCDLTNPRCECDSLGLNGAELEACLDKCNEDPCGCVAYCEYKHPETVDSCNKDMGCIKEALSKCIKDCEEMNSYCDDTCWNRNGACGDGIKGWINSEGNLVNNPNEACDNYVSGTATYIDLDGKEKGTVPNNKDGQYCTGKCRGRCYTTSPKCADNNSSNCWEIGCTVTSHNDTGTPSRCGDGFVDAFAGEVCDEGYGAGDDLNGFYGHCNKACNGYLPRCGDGNPDSGMKDERDIPINEICDKGANNGKYAFNRADSCNSDCQGTGEGGWCGDGTIQNETYDDCTTCTEHTCKDSQTLLCQSGVEGAAETCDPQDARTLSLTSSLVSPSDICVDCAKVGTCGDNKRNPRFEGCDCGGSEGKGECSEEYGILRTYQSESGVQYKCFSGCKANPIGNVEKANQLEISGWACDPDHPMEHPDIVKFEFYDKNGVMIHNAFRKTTKDIPGIYANVNIACGGGENHGFIYNPNSDGTGITNFIDQNPVTVRVYVKSLDYNKDDPDSEDNENEFVQIGEATFVMGQDCGDGIITKCKDIQVEFATQSTEIDDGYVCKDETEGHNACEGIEKCFEVKGKCSEYGFLNGAECVDEECDEGRDKNGPNGKCYDKTFGTACHYSYCGDGKLQADGNGKAYSDSIGYNESNYASANLPAFKEECESGSKSCQELFKTPCTDDINETPEGCVPYLNDTDSNKKSTVESKLTGCDSREGNTTGTCLWKRRDDCTITHACPSLDTAVNGKGWGWNAAGNSIHYEVNDTATTVDYTRTWNGSKWMPAAPTTLKHYTHPRPAKDTEADEACYFRCYNEGDTYGGARLEWDDSLKKCVEKQGHLSCGLCQDNNGINRETGESCKKSGWREVVQTISVEPDGNVKLTPPSLIDYPVVHEDHVPDGKNEGCAYACKKDTSYVGVEQRCMEDTATEACTGKPQYSSWVIIKKDDNGYVVESTGEEAPIVHQELDPDTGNYTPVASACIDNSTHKACEEGATNVTYYNATSNDLNNNNNLYKMSDGTFVKNLCYFVCNRGYKWNGRKCESYTPCGDGKVQTDKCSKTNGDVGTVKRKFGNVEKDVNCIYELNPQAQELCDDGTAFNGKYLPYPGYPWSSDVFVSACRNDCLDRFGISDTTPRGSFFCGDGLVQKKKNTDLGDSDGCGTNGATCKRVTGKEDGQYPGKGWIGDITSFTNEECDPNDQKNSTTALCNLLMGTNRSSYYTTNTSYSIGCSSCVIKKNSGDYTNNDKKGMCGYLGDGVIQRNTCTNIPSGVTCINSLPDNSGYDEECDPGKEDYTIQQLCQIKHGNNTYYGGDKAASTVSGLSCNSSGKVVGADKGTVCKWCGDEIINGDEGCDGSSYTNSATSCIRSASCGIECWNGCDKSSKCTYSSCSSKTCNSCVETWTCISTETSCGGSASNSCGDAVSDKVVYNY